ncbi:MAG: hypothetical protein AB7P22_14145 [Vicinamibacterales bacterium]
MSAVNTKPAGPQQTNLWNGLTRRMPAVQFGTQAAGIGRLVRDAPDDGQP